MHELSIATALIKQVLDVAGQNGLVKVEKVELEVGALQLVVPEALETAFSMVTEGTTAAGAVLVQREVPARARCRRCDHLFDPAIDFYLCPECGRADAEILAGRDIILSSLSGPVNENGGGS